MGLYCQPLMEGNLSQKVYKGTASFRDMGYDGKTTALNPRGNPVGYASVLSTSDPLTNENENTYDWEVQQAWKEMLITGTIDSANVYASYFPFAGFWPMDFPSPSPTSSSSGSPSSSHDSARPAPGPSPVAIKPPNFPTINLPCIKQQ